MSLTARRHLTRCTTCGWRLAVRRVNTTPYCGKCLPTEEENDE